VAVKDAPGGSPYSPRPLPDGGCLSSRTNELPAPEPDQTFTHLSGEYPRLKGRPIAHHRTVARYPLLVGHRDRRPNYWQNGRPSRSVRQHRPEGLDQTPESGRSAAHVDPMGSRHRRRPSPRGRRQTWLTRDTTPPPLPGRHRRPPRDPHDQPIVPDEEPPPDQP